MKILLQEMKSDNLVDKYIKQIKVLQRSQSNIVYRACFMLQKRLSFQFFITLAIITNSVLLALDRYPEDKNLTAVLEKVNIGFSLLFVFELAVKLTGLGFQAYFAEGYNVYDCLIVISSLIDIFLSNLLQQKSIGVITMFRGFRLMRVFKIAKHWSRLNHLLATIMQTLKDVGTFSILLFLVMMTFALLGMELFAFRVRFSADNKVDQEGSSPPSNYDSLLNAFTTVFVVMTADGWSGIFFNHYRSNPNIGTTIYFIFLIIVGQRIMLNLFLAILLQNFDEETMKEQNDGAIKDESEIDKNSLEARLERLKNWFVSCCREKVQKMRTSSFDEGDASSPPKRRFTQMVREHMEDRSFFVLTKNHAVRKWCIKAVQDSRFDWFVIAIIIISSVQLAMDEPMLDPESKYQADIRVIDQFTTAVFALESLMKAIAFGFAFNGD